MHSRTLARSLEIAPLSSARNFRWAVIVLVGLFVLVPVMLLVRRFSGELRVPLPGSAFFACAVVYGAAACGLRRAVTAVLPTDGPAAGWLASTWLSTICLVAFSVAIWLPGTSIMAVALTLLALVAEEALTWWLRPPARRLQRGSPSRRKSSQQSVGQAAGLTSSLAEATLQQLTHGRTEEGLAYWHGVIRAEFQPDQRVAAAHVAFCPPFVVPPEVKAWQLDGPPAEVRVTQTLCNGARLEIKLSAPCPRTSATVIEFIAQTVAPDTQASGT